MYSSNLRFQKRMLFIFMSDIFSLVQKCGQFSQIVFFFIFLYFLYFESLSPSSALITNYYQLERQRVSKRMMNQRPVQISHYLQFFFKYMGPKPELPIETDVCGWSWSHPIPSLVSG